MTRTASKGLGLLVAAALTAGCSGEPAPPTQVDLGAPTHVDLDRLPRGLSVSPDGTQVFVGDLDGIVVVDPATASVRERIPHPNVHWSHLRSTPDGQTLYLSVDDRIDQLDITGNRFTAPISKPNILGIPTITQDARRHVEVSGRTVSVVDLPSGQTQTWELPAPAGRICDSAIVPDGRRVYLTREAPYPSDNEVTLFVVDLDTRAIQPVPFSGRDGATVTGRTTLTMSPDGAELYASLPSQELAVIDTATNTVKRTVDFSDFGDLMLVSPSGRYVITVDKVSAEVHVLDLRDGRMLARGQTVPNPSEATLSPDGKQLYVINMSSGSGGVAPSGLSIVDLGEFS